jgi:uncharacterized membrane protein YeaQ/YmgE (transglycosylase-associated protein family)
MKISLRCSGIAGHAAVVFALRSGRQSRREPCFASHSSFKMQRRNSQRYRMACNHGELHMNLIIWLIIGGLAGWAAGKVMQGAGFGVIGNIVIGCCGAVLAGWILPELGIRIGSGFVREFIDALIGALVILLVLIGIRRAA